jgi:uncharacterized protein YbdZ (MbtH family)
MTKMDDQIVSLSADRPGWRSRLFGLDVGRLIACDARKSGDRWERGDSFNFLYRSRRAKYFLLTSVRDWRVVTEADARALYSRLEHKTLAEEHAFAPAEHDPLPADDDDPRTFLVVKNHLHEYSIWPQRKELPDGWKPYGFSGKKIDCLDFIRRNCVFGAP